MRWQAMLALASLLVAGCAAPSSEPLQAEPRPPPGSESPLSSNATAPDAPASTNATDRTAPAPLRVESFVWTGRVPLYACIPAGPGTCEGLVSVGDESTLVFENRTPLAAVLDLSWSAATPATEQLVFRINAVASCGEGCTRSNALVEATGPSPLHIEAVAIRLADGEQLGLEVTTPSPFPPPLYGTVSTPQAFGATGNLTFAP